MLVCWSPSPLTSPQDLADPHSPSSAFCSFFLYRTHSLFFLSGFFPPFPFYPPHSLDFFSLLPLSLPLVIKNALMPLLNVNKVIHTNDKGTRKRRGGKKKEKEKKKKKLRETETKHLATTVIKQKRTLRTKACLYTRINSATDLRRKIPYVKNDHQTSNL